MDTETVLKQGIAHHQDGDLGAAARCYRDVLAADPGNVDALNLMAQLAIVAGHLDKAVELAGQSIAGQPDFFAPHLTLGNALQALGRLDEALAAFKAGIALEAGSAACYSNMASVLNALGRHDEALDAAIQAVMRDGKLAEARNNFGNALLALGSPDEAAEAYELAIELAPDLASARFNLGNAFSEMAAWDEAAEAYRAALGLEEKGAWWFNLGNALLAAKRDDEAEAAFNRARELEPDNCDAAINLANLMVAQGRLAEAETVLAHAMARLPDDPEIRFNLALVLLRQGRMAEGWREYECRWSLASFQPYRRDFGKPQWTGEAFEGRILLIHAEQGFGDALQIARLIPRVADLGGAVVVECRPGLARLFATLDPRIRVVAVGEVLPSFDLHVPMMSLPACLGITLDDLPGPVPYLSAPEPDRFADLAAVPGLKVGVVWAGSATRRADGRRSLGAADLAPLMAVPGIALYSLQVGGDGAPPDGMVDLAPRLKDFADTAAAITMLDLVVTVDTAVAHLAGAMAKPVWVMLSKPCDGFLWMEDRADSPWYPSARLFRQPVEGDWAAVVAEIASELKDMT